MLNKITFKEIEKKKYSLLYVHSQCFLFFPVDLSLHLVSSHSEELPSVSIVAWLVLTVFICLKMSLLHLPFLKNILARNGILGWEILSAFYRYHLTVFWPLLLLMRIQPLIYIIIFLYESFFSSCFQVFLFIFIFQQYDCDVPGMVFFLSILRLTVLLGFYKSVFHKTWKFSPPSLTTLLKYNSHTTHTSKVYNSLVFNVLSCAILSLIIFRTFSLPTSKKKSIPFCYHLLNLRQLLFYFLSL